MIETSDGTVWGNRYGQRTAGIGLVLFAAFILVSCAEPPAIATAPAYSAPVGEAASLARLSSTIEDPGLVMSDIWGFAANIDGYPVPQKRKTLHTTTLTPGKHIIEAACVFTGSNDAGGTAHIELKAEAGHDYEIQCRSQGLVTDVFTVWIMDRTLGKVVASGAAPVPPPDQTPPILLLFS